MSMTAPGALWSVFETVLVLSIVAACAVYALRALWPAAWRRARIACALPLLREGRPPWLRALGHLLAPAPALTPKAGSCGPCRGCEKGSETDVALAKSTVFAAKSLDTPAHAPVVIPAKAGIRL
jgi:hypothetical protein